MSAMLFCFCHDPLTLSRERSNFPRSFPRLGTCQKLAGGRRGGGGDGNLKFMFGNEVTHPCNGSKIC